MKDPEGKATVRRAGRLVPVGLSAPGGGPSALPSHQTGVSNGAAGGPSPPFCGFSLALFEFLEELADHNNRLWFSQNKHRYEQWVRQPALAFIRAFRPRLARISKFFLASDRPVGGSLLRIYRDLRFGKDKTPYKTNVGIQFRHQQGKDIHAPGFYVHLEPGECFLALGIWRPDRDALAAVRRAIAENPAGWQQAVFRPAFQAVWTLEGDRLQRPPKGFPANHPCIEDLKRTDYIAVADLDEQDTYRPELVDRVAEAFRAGRPLMQFLCNALQLPF